MNVGSYIMPDALLLCKMLIAEAMGVEERAVCTRMLSDFLLSFAMNLKQLWKKSDTFKLQLETRL